MKKFVSTAIFGLALAVVSANAQVYVRIGPPPVRVEHPGPPPAPNYIWVNGYHQWNGRAYIWVPGHYERIPHPHARWVDGHWRQTPHGWVWVEGHWRS